MAKTKTTKARCEICNAPFDGGGRLETCCSDACDDKLREQVFGDMRFRIEFLEYKDAEEGYVCIRKEFKETMPTKKWLAEISKTIPLKGTKFSRVTAIDVFDNTEPGVYTHYVAQGPDCSKPLYHVLENQQVKLSRRQQREKDQEEKGAQQWRIKMWQGHSVADELKGDGDIPDLMDVLERAKKAGANKIYYYEGKGSAAKRKVTKNKAGNWVDSFDPSVPIKAEEITLTQIRSKAPKAVIVDEIAEQMKTCPKCGFIGIISADFGFRNSNGKTIPQSYCRSCRSNKGDKSGQTTADRASGDTRQIATRSQAANRSQAKQQHTGRTPTTGVGSGDRRARRSSASTGSKSRSRRS